MGGKDPEDVVCTAVHDFASLPRWSCVESTSICVSVATAWDGETPIRGWWVCSSATTLYLLVVAGCMASLRLKIPVLVGIARSHSGSIFSALRATMVKGEGPQATRCRYYCPFGWGSVQSGTPGSVGRSEATRLMYLYRLFVVRLLFYFRCTSSMPSPGGTNSCSTNTIERELS